MIDRANGFLAPEVCRRAADVLGGDAAGETEFDAEAKDLLQALGYAPGGGCGERADRRALLRLAARFRRLFRLLPPDAPDLVFLGGEAVSGLAGDEDPLDETVSLAGAGVSLQDAFERCVGEGAEYLSQIGLETDIACRGRPSGVPHGLDRDTLSHLLAMLAGEPDADAPEIDWVVGRCLSSAQDVLLPADLCLRRPGHERGLAPLVNVGTGCAAGPTDEAATRSAVLELVERDAAALWWAGGRSPCPISLEVGAAAGAGELLRRLRGGATTRHSWLLDITTDLGVPSVASVSLAGDGDGFACGLAAGLTIGSAIRSAILEMCQMELSHRIIALKCRLRGESALNDHDLAHLERGRTIGANDSEIQPKGTPNDWWKASDESTLREISFQFLLKRMEELGVSIYAVNLTRDRFSVPVSKVIATRLQPYPADIETSRLTKSIERHNSSNKSAHCIPLL